MAADGSLPAHPLKDAELCVKCGLCLPHCPTYRLAQDEAESPRGRIALMQGLANGWLEPTPALSTHLDRCLGCRACEAVCPAEVPYGRLIDRAREQLASAQPARTRLTRALGWVFTSPLLQRLVALLLILYQRSGLQALLRRRRWLGEGSLARLESLVPRVYWPRRGVAAGRAAVAADVQLFVNCTSPWTEPQALAAAARLLRAAGYRVSAPRAQTCCGALHQHAGLPRSAQRCAQRNLQAFSGAAAVAGIASGCTAQLREYPEVLAGDPRAAAFAGRVADVHALLAARAERLRFHPLQGRVLLHTPCTLRNVVRGDAAVRQLLARIPQLEVVPMPTGCCGAAGSYFLTQPRIADQLLAPRVAQAQAAHPDYVLSSNVGCSLQLEAGLRRAGLKAPVWHPVRLLAQQLAPG